MLVETSPDALIALAADGTILFWSTGAQSVYGYTSDDAVGLNLHELVMESERSEEYRQLIRRAIDTGLAVHETVHRKKDGSPIYVDITVKPVRDRHGDLQFVAASHKDVTAIKVLNHGKILDARYRGLLETVPDAIFMVNNPGRIVLI